MDEQNIRISINDLVSACRVLGEVRVLAAGSLYATLSVDEIGRNQLAKNKIEYCFD